MEGKLLIACDHAGYQLKEILSAYLKEKGYEIKDMGTHSEESVDYPDFIHPLCKSISEGEVERGIIICGSGNGVSMVANKYEKIRAALSWNVEIAELARLHNDANILSIPARFISVELAKEITDVFLNTAFEGGRHQRRVEKIAIK